MFTTTVYFNNFNLSSLPGVKIYDYNVTELPERTLNTSKLARADKSILTSAEYVKKPVYIYGYVGGVNKAAIDQNFDRLKGTIQVNEGAIVVEQGGLQIKYTGTLNTISKQYFGNNLKFTLEFICSDPIGKDSTPQLLLSTNIITSSITRLLVIEGSYKAFPLFNMVIDSVTDGTDKNISLLNAATGQGIKINADFENGDIVSVNSATMDVLLNSSPVDFEGSFPFFFPGTRSFQYIDDFTARDVDLTITYNRQYT